MRRIGQVREFSDTWITDISPMALKVLTENTTKSMQYNLEWNGEYGFEVKDSWGNTFIVNLGTQTCTCRSWTLRGIPCCHAIAALHFKRLEPINYVHIGIERRLISRSIVITFNQLITWKCSHNRPTLLYYHLLSKHYQEGLKNVREKIRMKIK